MTDFGRSLNHSVQNNLAAWAEEFGFDQLVLGHLKSPLTIDFYEKWLAGNHFGNMQYLQNHLPIKKDPRLLESRLRSVISVAQSYYPAARPQYAGPARVALYAQNEDYHYWLKEKLAAVIARLSAEFPDEVFLPFVDSGPVLERDMAYQNGLGWFGKNTCLIHPKHGSLFFVAEILTSLAGDFAPAMEPLPDFCGTCTRCIDICPTGALQAPKLMKADLCISYLTIEAKGAPPEELRKKMGDWFFGCDLCQTVCPWNQKVFRQREEAASSLTSTSPTLDLTAEKRRELAEYFRELLTSSHKKIQKAHLGSPLSRAGAKGLKRNALIVIANQNLTELKECVEQTEWPDDLQELAQWTLQQLS
jgi:epoxyqueuosine reductase